MDADSLRRLARKTGFDLATLEKDCALTWLLCGIYRDDSPLADFPIFKGGTAIRKIHFPEWRLSEDMDFTVVKKGGAKEIRPGFEQVFKWLKEESGIQFGFSSFHPNANAVLADVQFLGPLGHKNRIARDVTLKETLVEEPQRVKVKPEYDAPEFTVLVYSVNEILVEKLRSILQRGKARDYYGRLAPHTGEGFRNGPKSGSSSRRNVLSPESCSIPRPSSPRKGWRRRRDSGRSPLSASRRDCRRSRGSSAS